MAARPLTVQQGLDSRRYRVQTRKVRARFREAKSDALRIAWLCGPAAFFVLYHALQLHPGHPAEKLGIIALACLPVSLAITAWTCASRDALRHTLSFRALLAFWIFVAVGVIAAYLSEQPTTWAKAYYAIAAACAAEMPAIALLSRLWRRRARS